MIDSHVLCKRGVDLNLKEQMDSIYHGLSLEQIPSFQPTQAKTETSFNGRAWTIHDLKGESFCFFPVSFWPF